VATVNAALRRVANQRAAARMLEFLDETALEWLPVSEAAMDRALEVQRLLAAHVGNGHRRPIPALIIAATAELRGAEVLHVDSDYE
jgi:predicted nucleic acid-binding protein